jgi:hypothetical protein
MSFRATVRLTGSVCSASQTESHGSLDRLGLLGQPDRAHAPLAESLQQLVGTNDRTGSFTRRRQTNANPAVGSRRFTGFVHGGLLAIGLGNCATKGSLG